ncbi:hypothetical protein F5Y10DRAFT_234461 [Nemania abortiva]|nr:hypothetical protein F5Y10DRAFT_234461 [Nemania abortiva]
MQLTLLYGERLFPIAEEPNFYHLVGNMLLKRRMPWSLLYLDRSQLQIPLSVPSSKKKKRRRRPRRSAAARRKALKKAQAQDGEEKKKKTPPTPPNQGVIASMFIAIAQHRLLDISDLDENDEQPEANNAQRPVAQQDVRYQILLTDNAVSSAYIHLYTAQVSDFLLECFKTPTRLPRVAPPSRDSPLMRVHHAAVPYIPRASFQQRLYEAIRKHANGTADGFFSSSGE